MGGASRGEVSCGGVLPSLAPLDSAGKQQVAELSQFLKVSWKSLSSVGVKQATRWQQHRLQGSGNRLTFVFALVVDSQVQQRQQVVVVQQNLVRRPLEGYVDICRTEPNPAEDGENGRTSA